MKYRFLLKSFLILRKKNISLNTGNLSENSFNIAKNEKIELITSRHFKNLISPKLAWNSQPVESNSFKKFKVIQSMPIAYFAHISDFFKTKLEQNRSELILTIKIYGSSFV